MNQLQSRRRWRLAIAAVHVAAGCIATASILACSSETEPLFNNSASTTSGPGTCTPGDKKTCPCSGGEMGTETCSADGTSYLACSCPSTTGTGTGGGGMGGAGVCSPGE